MAVWHDKTIGKIFNKVAEESGVSPSQVRDLYEKYFEFAASAVSSGFMPDVNLFGFGRLVPNTKQLRVMRRKCDAGILLDCDYCEKVNFMLERAESEKIKRKRKKDE